MMGNEEKIDGEEVGKEMRNEKGRKNLPGERRSTRTRAETRKKQKQTSEMLTWNGDSLSLATKGNKQPN